MWDYEWIKAGNHFRFSHEFILYATRPGHKRTFGGGVRDVWRIRPVNPTRPRFHRAQKPVELIQKIIELSSKPGETVLDTFLGSGTTALVCSELKRKCVGMELKEANLITTLNRLDESKETLFTPADSAGKEKVK